MGRGAALVAVLAAGVVVGAVPGTAAAGGLHDAVSTTDQAIAARAIGTTASAGSSAHPAQDIWIRRLRAKYKKTKRTTVVSILHYQRTATVKFSLAKKRLVGKKRHAQYTRVASISKVVLGGPPLGPMKTVSIRKKLERGIYRVTASANGGPQAAVDFRVK